MTTNSSEKTRLQALRLRALASAERERASARRGDLPAAMMHESGATAYDRWASELETMAAMIDGVHATNKRLRKQMADMGLELDNGAPTSTE